jgi:hypothetical protein
MKKVLLTVALGMLLSAVCMAAGIETVEDAEESSVAQDVTVQSAPNDSATVKQLQSASNDSDAAKQLQAAQEQAAREKAAREEAERNLQDVLEKGPPLWVIDPVELEKVIDVAKLDGVFVGIGSATNPRDYQAIQMAEARARQDIAFQRQALIKAEITDFAKNIVSAKSGSASSSNASEEYMVGQQSVETQLLPVKVLKRQKQVDSDTWWVVVSTVIPGKPEAQTTAEPAGPYTYTPEAMDRVKLMDERLEKNKLKSTVVSPVVTEVGIPLESSEAESE